VKGLVRQALAAFALLALFASVSSADAFGAGYDRSFGAGGTAFLGLPAIARAPKIEAQESRTAPDGSTYVLADQKCERQKKCPVASQFLFKFGRDGRPDRSFDGGKGYYPIRGRGFEGLAVDERGRPLLSRTIVSPEVARLTPGGHRDPSFGRHGQVLLPRLTEDLGTVESLPGGGVLVTTEALEPEGGFNRYHLAELREDGRPVGGFGRGGIVNVDLAGEYHDPPVISADGAIYVVGEEGATLSRLSARGRLDATFNRAARRTLGRYVRALHSGDEWGETATLVARRGGGVDVFDVFGFFDEKGVEAQVGADGKPVAGFGHAGVRVLDQQVWGGVEVGGGEIFAFGEPLLGIDNVFLLRADGSPDRRFHGGEPILLPEDAGDGAPASIGHGLVDLAYNRAIPCRGCRKAYLSRFVLPGRLGR
jgi:hypothetical protein